MRICAQKLKVNGRLLVEAEAAIEAADVVVARREVVARRKKDQEVLLAHVMLQTKDSDGRVLANDAVAGNGQRVRVEALLNCEIAGRIVRREEYSEGVAPALARQLRSDVRVNNRARVDRLNECGEDVFAF